MDERLKEAIGKVLEIKAEYEELRRTGYQDELFARELKGSEISLIAKEGLFSEDEAIRGSSAIAISYAPTANHLIFTREHLDLILEASKNPELAEPCLYAAETLAEKRPDIFEKRHLDAVASAGNEPRLNPHRMHIMLALSRSREQHVPFLPDEIAGSQTSFPDSRIELFEERHVRAVIEAEKYETGWISTCGGILENVITKRGDLKDVAISGLFQGLRTHNRNLYARLIVLHAPKRIGEAITILKNEIRRICEIQNHAERQMRIDTEFGKIDDSLKRMNEVLKISGGFSKDLGQDKPEGLMDLKLGSIRRAKSSQASGNSCKYPLKQAPRTPCKT